MGEDFSNLPLDDKIKYLKENISHFSTSNYANPKIAATLEELYKEIKELKKSPPLSKDEHSKEKQITQLKELIEFFEKHGDKESAESMKGKLKDMIGGKKGLFPYLNIKMKILGISIPVGTLLILGGISYGVWYLSNNTDVFRVTKRLEEYKTTMQQNTKKVQEYSLKIDNFGKKYSDEYFNTQKKSIDDTFANQQNSLDGQLKSYSDQIVDLKSSYEKQISDLKNDIVSYKDSYEKLKVDNEAYKKSYDELKATNEEYKNSLDEMKKNSEKAAARVENLEKRITESEKKYDEKINKLKKPK